MIKKLILFLIVFVGCLKTVCVAQQSTDTLCLSIEKVQELVTYKQQKLVQDKKIIELNNTIFLLNQNTTDYQRSLQEFILKDSIHKNIQGGFNREIQLKNEELVILNKAIADRDKLLRREKLKKKLISFGSLSAIAGLTYLYITK